MKTAESSPKRLETTERKKEIARYEQFLLFSQCFQKTCPAGLVWERVKPYTVQFELSTIAHI